MESTYSSNCDALASTATRTSTSISTPSASSSSTPGSLNQTTGLATYQFVNVGIVFCTSGVIAAC